LPSATTEPSRPGGGLCGSRARRKGRSGKIWAGGSGRGAKAARRAGKRKSRPLFLGQAADCPGRRWKSPPRGRRGAKNRNSAGRPPLAGQIARPISESIAATGDGARGFRISSAPQPPGRARANPPLEFVAMGGPARSSLRSRPVLAFEPPRNPFPEIHLAPRLASCAAPADVSRETPPRRRRLRTKPH